MTNPVVSVVMAVRDCEPYIRDAVGSALRQDFQSFEIIAVDDGSIDGTRDILEKIDDSRVRVLTSPQLGPAAARNVGLRAARGKFIALLDGDDMWDAGKLAAHVAAFDDHPDVDLIFSLSRFVDDRGNALVLPTRRISGRFDFGSLLRDNVTGNGSAVVVRRSSIPADGFDESLTACIDYDLWLRVALQRPGNVFCIPVELVSYRRHAGQVTGNWRRMQKGWKATMARMERLNPAEFERSRAVAASNWFRYLSFLAYESGDKRDALALLGSSVRSSGRVALRNPRTWLLAMAISSSVILPASLHGRLQRRALALSHAALSS